MVFGQIPLWSILGSTLVNIVINDPEKNIIAGKGCKLHKISEVVNKDKDRSVLQSDQVRLARWNHLSSMAFKTTKFKDKHLQKWNLGQSCMKGECYLKKCNVWSIKQMMFQAWARDNT